MSNTWHYNGTNKFHFDIKDDDTTHQYNHGNGNTNAAISQNKRNKSDPIIFELMQQLTAQLTLVTNNNDGTSNMVAMFSSFTNDGILVTRDAQQNHTITHITSQVNF